MTAPVTDRLVVLAQRSGAHPDDLLLDALVETALRLPGGAVIASPRPLHKFSTMNLMALYAGALPSSLPLRFVSSEGSDAPVPNTVADPDYRGALRALSEPVGTRVRSAGPTVNPTRFEFNSVSKVERSVGASLLALLDELWTGASVHGVRLSDFRVEFPEFSTRFAARFHHEPGDKLPSEGDAFVCRLLWSHRSRATSFVDLNSILVRLPDLSTPIELDAMARAAYEAEYKTEHDNHAAHSRWSSAPCDEEVRAHDTYNHLKLAALHAVMNSRSLVTTSDWTVTDTIMRRSCATRAWLYGHRKPAP